MKKKFFGLIPARGGSKGIPKKNIIDLNGKPLIHYTIEAAIKSKNLDDFIVSSDDRKILEISERLNIKTHLRNKTISKDQSPMIDVMLNIVDEYELILKGYEFLVLLQPTCPLRTAKDIDNAISSFDKSGADTLISCYKVDDAHPARMYTIKNKFLNPINKDQANLNRQDLTEVFHRNGAVYIFKISNIKNKIQFGEKLFPFIMEEERSLNVDNFYDLKLARLIMNKK